MRRCFVVLFGWCVVLGACTDANKASDDQAVNEAATEAVAKRMAEYAAAVRTANIDSIRAYWADNSRFYEPGAPMMTRDAMMTMAGEMLKAHSITALDVKVTETLVHDRGTVAYQFGEVHETLTPRSGKGAAMNERFFFVMRWSKQANGTWNADRFMETPMPKPAVPGSK